MTGNLKELQEQIERARAGAKRILDARALLAGVLSGADRSGIR